ncbi:MAG: hypothetical protein ABII12_13700 [Planctomycetota bacterium]
MSSCDLFLWLLVIGDPSGSFIFVETLVLLSVVAVLLVAGKHRQKPTEIAISPTPAACGMADRTIWSSFLLVLVLAMLVLVLLSLSKPHGAVDGWSIWNMRARFLFRSGEHWRAALSPHVGCPHQDYPLLLSASIARSWYYVGKDTVFVPITIAMLFTLATAVLLTSAVSVLVGTFRGLLAGIAILGTCYFIRHGAYQYADIPLSFFILASIVLLYLHGRTTGRTRGLLYLSGMMAGMAAWTKNEGVLFVAGIVCSHLIVGLATKQLKPCFLRMAAIMLGLAPIFGIVTYFKLGLAPPNDLAAAQNLDTAMAKLCNADRYWIIGKYWVQRLIGYGNGLVFVLATYAVLVGVRVDRRDRQQFAVCLLTLSLMLAGHFVVYLLTPHDLVWHLGTSARRLFLQLLPMGLFVFFTTVTGPAGAPGSPCRNQSV